MTYKQQIDIAKMWDKVCTSNAYLFLFCECLKSDFRKVIENSKPTKWGTFA